VESHLWDAHSSINNRYRKILARYKTEERRRLVVERRKWEQRYVDFLKRSQYFYKGYIQRLTSHFDGLSELRKIAHRLQLNTLSADNRVKVSDQTEHNILLSCHATLLRLGDLSRYRNDIRTKDRSWDMAMTYYGLANDLYPKSGNAFNQMAVISLSEGQHLNAIYHLYRALAIEEPHPVAEGNLAIEFKKITKEWASGSKPSLPKGVDPAGEVAGPLISWFVRLHAKLYKGEEFSGHDELENEVLSQMTVLLKEQSLEGILDKIVLINIAAEYFGAERLQSKY
jgi:Est1 DNA/RNA binding domain/Telomerase activating protein Est1